MADDIHIYPVVRSDLDLLIGMYDRFDPLGEALGLPPPAPEARHQWIGEALSNRVNLAAFSPAGEVVGHCFLVEDDNGSAELAVFVHQKFRRRGIGTALVKAALAAKTAAGLQRIWALTASDNMAAIRLQLKCGFRPASPVFAETTLEIDLNAA
jgi:RimJ/RimL family protein N-acetyltransferase